MSYIAILNSNNILFSEEEQKEKILKHGIENNISIETFIDLNSILSKDNKLIHIDYDYTYIILSPLIFGGSIIEILKNINIFFKNNINIISLQYSDLLSNNKTDIINCIIQIQKDIISYRTKKGLEATKKKGVKLGRPKGVKNKNRIFDEFRLEILEYLNNGTSVNKILTNINKKLNKNITYSSIKYFIDNDSVLKKARSNFKSDSLLG
jgi:hypothetical protein